MTSRQRADHAAKWLRDRGETEVSVWDKDKIKAKGWPWMQGATFAVVCEGEFEWTYEYAEKFANNENAHQFSPGSGWCLNVY